MKVLPIIIFLTPAIVGLGAGIIARRRRGLPLISKVPAVRGMYLTGLTASLYPSLVMGSIFFEKYPMFTWTMRSLFILSAASLVTYTIRGRRLVRTVRSLNGAACLTCVYPFDAHSGICPECGTPYDRDDVIQQWRQERVLDDAVLPKRPDDGAG